MAISKMVDSRCEQGGHFEQHYPMKKPCGVCGVRGSSAARCGAKRRAVVHPTSKLLDEDGSDPDVASIVATKRRSNGKAMTDGDCVTRTSHFSGFVDELLSDNAMMGVGYFFFTKKEWDDTKSGRGIGVWSPDVAPHRQRIAERLRIYVEHHAWYVRRRAL